MPSFRGTRRSKMASLYISTMDTLIVYRIVSLCLHDLNSSSIDLRCEDMCNHFIHNITSPLPLLHTLSPSLLTHTLASPCSTYSPLPLLHSPLPPTPHSPLPLFHTLPFPCTTLSPSPYSTLPFPCSTLSPILDWQTHLMFTPGLSWGPFIV